jgi:hypothetical protein
MFIALPLKYSALIFVAVIGVLQAAAAHNNLRGMLFFRRILHAYIFAGITIVVPLGMFFTWNYMFAVGYVAGSQQAGLFFFSSAAAIVFTLIVSSLVNFRLKPERPTPLTGLDALKEDTFFHLFLEKIKRKP